MKNYLNFEADIKNLEEELEKLKDPYNQSGLSEVDTQKISKTQKKIQTVYLDNIIKSSRVIDVVNYFIKKKNIKNIYFIIGSDNLIRFHKWKSWKKIVKLVKLIVFSRRGYDRKGMNSMVVKNFKNKIIFIKNKHIAISSSQLKSQTKSNN